tara:strand:- start:4037 stop:4687 length:651 start_codon:yes stop_codon:yes gene_type:complete
MNYAELTTNIQDVCENTFTAAQLALFTQQAEQRIYNTVQLPTLRRNVTGLITSSNKYLTAPLDFLSVYSIAVIDAAGDYTYLLNKDVNFIREAYPSAAASGVPKYYAIFGPSIDDADVLTFILGPTPNAAYSTELHYYFYPESIVTANETWLGEHFDSALLNASLTEAIRFMKGEPDLVKLYNDMYVQSIALLKNLGDGKLRTDAYRDGQTRISAS